MKTIRIVVFAGLLTVGTQAIAEEGKCHCVANGTTYVEGQTACLKIGSTPFLARCDRFLNNTTWTRVGDSCDSQQTSMSDQVDETATLEVAGILDHHQ
ncbi:MAG: hypothetical protein R3D45_07415 [Rhizobiaceae bacterium]